MNREQKAKYFFNNTPNYLTTEYGIRIRKETIDSVLSSTHFDSALDIGCGDGSISINQVENFNSLTLLDISENMLKIAERKTPDKFKPKVSYINKPFDSHL
ncbi:MAG: methyltransferase domain-containing protein, partial [Flavobacteriales bacterium]|nr:methyltransferase domain-containing protein [Flavobacteriales bacterium]